MDDPPTLTEVYIQDCFHSYLRSSLTQAKAERLLGVEILASAEGDLMITGPALCLFFAAIRSTTNPPSVPLPRLDKNQPPAELSPSNCPPAYASFLRVWSNTVQPIQSLAPEYQHDLARLICNLEPVSSSPPRDLPRIAADLRAVAIEISQRRTFQERYSDDLQAAIDAGAPGTSGPSRGQGSAKAAFVPPPSYDDASTPGSSRRPSPSSPALELPPTEPLRIHRRTPSSTSGTHQPATLAPGVPVAGVPSFPVPSIPDYNVPGGHRRTPSASSTASSAAYSGAPQSPGLLSPVSANKPLPPSPSSSSAPLRSRSPSFLPSHGPAIEVIRETLYASLADVLGRSPSLRALLKSDPTRAYFGAVALAILEVSVHAVTREGSVVGVLGQELTLAHCPEPLRPLMLELGALGRAAREMEEADSDAAVQAMTTGEELPPPRLERVKLILEEGVGVRDAAERGEDENRRSIEGRALAFANRVNGLALAMTRLRPFRERQDEVFKVLAGVDN